MIRDLHQRLPHANVCFVGSALLLVLCLSRLHALGAPYADPVANLGLQLAADTEVFRAALARFSVDPAKLADYQFWDTMLPAAYALFLALLVGLMAQILTAAGKRSLALLGAGLSLVLPLAAVFDWIENQLLLSAFAGEPSAIPYYIEAGRHFSAAPKYLLLSIAAAWLLFALPAVIAGRPRPQRAV